MNGRLKASSSAAGRRSMWPVGWRPAVVAMAAAAMLAAAASAVAAPAGSSLVARQVAADRAFAVVLDHIRGNEPSLGLTRRDLADVVVSSTVTDWDTATTHVYLQQRYRGIEVTGAILNASVDREGEIVTVGNRFVGGLEAAVGETTPARSAVQGIAAAARAVGLRLEEAPTLRAAARGPARASLFDGAGISSRPIPVRLVYVQDDAGLRLAWNVVIRETDRLHWWDVTTDATTGAALTKHDRFEAAESSSYTIFPLPVEAPTFGSRAIVTSPYDTLASPFGWHDTDGADGAESTLTSGNNVEAFQPGPNFQPDGTASLTFDFPLDLTQKPDTYTPASVTNAFYWSNVLHDVLYRHGFTEEAGNFQVNNYGRGGVGGDPVVVKVQNPAFGAFFGTPPDGQSPEMVLGTQPPPPFWHVLMSAPQTMEFAATPVGPAFPPVTGEVVLVNDGTAPVEDACQPPGVSVSGKIALVFFSGNCGFWDAVEGIRLAGGIGVIAANTRNQGTFGGIAVFQISEADAVTLSQNLPATVTMGGLLKLDLALDAGLIAHEYGHGVSNRLVGGPENVGCLFNDEQMGEGWSDVVALVLTARGAAAVDRTRGLGSYVNGQPTSGPGIRGLQYSTDVVVNGWSYDDIKRAQDPHMLGARWAAALWDVYWNLVDDHGFNQDLYGDWTTGGNNLALRLVLDGMKLTPCSPGFVDARDAILAADENLTGGANSCAIWRGFAKRGLGVGASQGSPLTRGDGSQAFDVPAECGAATSVAITSDTPDPSNLGQPVTVGFSVSAGAGSPSGHVKVSDGVSSCTATVAAGQCVLTLATAGARTLTAYYYGEEGFGGSTSAGEPHLVNTPPVVVGLAGSECLSSAPAAGTIQLFGHDPDGDALAVTLVSSSNPALVPSSGVSADHEIDSLFIITVSASKRVKSGTSTLSLEVSDGVAAVPVVVTVVVGTNTGQALTGTPGTDMLFGGNARDTLAGGSGGDLLCGAGSPDVLDGGPGFDSLGGGSGADTLTGGADADFFSGGPGKDVATDLNPSTGDVQDGTVP